MAYKKFLTVTLSMILSGAVAADKAIYSRKHVILDLMTLQQPGAPFGTLDSVIGYISPEIFESKELCESALVTEYAGNIWQIEKTEDEHRSGELRLHRYQGDQPFMIRFCTAYIEKSD